MNAAVWDGPTTLEAKGEEDTKQEDYVPDEADLMIQSLKKCYKTKLYPLEQEYKFQDFTSFPALNDSFFDAKPMVLLIGQYSVGKTTFIRYLLERDFPGVRIGPEPTTDRFMALKYGETDRTIPGPAAVSDASSPFGEATKFGMGFLSKFEVIECQSPILKKVSFIDTPGILSGEKQRTGRGYDFPEMCEWFAYLCDRIILLFDANKLDISDEMRKTIEHTRDFDDKIRVVLNKADIPTQQLIRVYGALMWSLGKVYQTPEVLRVYIGSFWDQPLKNAENTALLKLEEQDLLTDLNQLPHNAAVRKVNLMTIRTRKAILHRIILTHLKEKLPYMGAKKAKAAMVENMAKEFKEISVQYNEAKTNFPKIGLWKAQFAKVDISKYPTKKKTRKLADAANDILAKDLPKLMQMIPSETEDGKETKEQGYNPFARDAGGIEQVATWVIDKALKRKYNLDFEKLPITGGKVAGQDLKDPLLKSGLQMSQLMKLFELADLDKDGKFDADEWCVAQYLIDNLKNGNLSALPDALPDSVIPPSKRYLFQKKL